MEKVEEKILYAISGILYYIRYISISILVSEYICILYQVFKVHLYAIMLFLSGSFLLYICYALFLENTFSLHC